MLLPVYAVIIGDLVKSRAISNRAHVQRRLLAIIDELNSRYEPQLLSRFALTAGDEFQGALTVPQDSFDITLSLITSLFPVEGRFGIGLGPLATDISDQVQSMDGPCFHRARDAITSSRVNNRLITCVTGEANLELVLDALLLSCQRILEGLTSRQRQMVVAVDQYKTQTDLAKALQVNKATVSRTLNRAGYKELKAIQHALRAVTDFVVAR